MRAGELNRVIKLQRNIRTIDDTGEGTDDWETYSTTWGGFRRQRSTRTDEKHQHDHDVHSNYAKLVVYYNPAIKTSDRVIDTTKERNEIYQIMHIEQGNYDEHLILSCKRIY